MSCFVFYLKLSIETLVDFQYPENGKVVRPKPDQPDLFRRPCHVVCLYKPYIQTCVEHY